VLFDGKAGITAVGTSREFGYRFKAFPHAERPPGYVRIRAFSRGAVGDPPPFSADTKNRTPVR
jgi:hypothetical protein